MDHSLIHNEDLIKIIKKYSLLILYNTENFPTTLFSYSNILLITKPLNSDLQKHDASPTKMSMSSS